MESEARDLRLGAAGSLLFFGGGGLVMAWTTGESEWFGASAIGVAGALLIWIKSRFVASRGGDV